MHGSKKAVAALCFAFGLSACNTTDALTPQADIPNAGTARAGSGPVTQADAERLASDSAPDAAPARPPRRQGARGAQNTLQAQAEALQGGNAEQPASAPVQTPPAQPAETAAAANGEASIRFLPIIGAPVQAVTPLSRQLGTDARANGLAIKASGDSSSQHILKGYFSAFSDGSQTTVVYVWDVLDGNGARLHRIQGQDSVPGGGPDPWANVPASAMQSIATKTIQEYMRWRSQHAG